MDSDAMDVCVGPNNKDPDGTRRRCGQKHFTRLHMQLHSTARLAVIENQDTLDYQFYLKMKSQDGFPSNPAPSVTRGRSGFCDNLVTVATVIGILGCGAYLLLPECVLLANCAPIAATANSVAGWTLSSAMVPFVAAGPPPAVTIVATLYAPPAPPHASARSSSGTTLLPSLRSTLCPLPPVSTLWLCRPCLLPPVANDACPSSTSSFSSWCRPSFSCSGRDSGVSSGLHGLLGCATHDERLICAWQGYASLRCAVRLRAREATASFPHRWLF